MQGQSSDQFNSVILENQALATEYSSMKQRFEALTAEMYILRQKQSAFKPSAATQTSGTDHRTGEDPKYFDLLLQRN